MEKFLKQLREKMFVRKIRVTTLVSAAVALLICIEAFSIFCPKEHSIKASRILVARRDLMEASPLRFVDLAFEHLPTDKIPSGALTDQDLQLVKGAILERSLKAGQVLTLEEIRLSPRVAGLSSTIPAGHRAYLLFSEQAKHLKYGDRVDVAVIAQGPEQAPLILLERALVMDSDTDTQNNEVLLALTQEEINVLEENKRSGTLTVLLRNPTDLTREGRSKRRKKVKGIEVWAD